ncbi:hypothetical protein OTU49_000836, partial [Cherax quadricarinatus]
EGRLSVFSPHQYYLSMMKKILFVAFVSVACAASVEKREGVAGKTKDTVGQTKDTVVQPKESVGEGRDSGSSYAAPAPAPTYDDGGSQGNLYYYYYPVSEYGSAETSDSEYEVLTAIILPLLILGGILLGLSSLTFTLTTQRALTDGPNESDFVTQLHDEIERVFYIYLNAIENEECIKRTICEIGVYSKDLKGKDIVLGLIEPLIPEGMKSNLAIFKKAAESGYETGKCMKFKCNPPKLL